MDDHVIHLEQFYVQQNNYKSICKIHVIEHENFKFFALLELRDRRAHLHIDELIEGINFAFNKIFKTKSIKVENIELLFEKSIKDLNTYIFDLIKLSELPIKVTGLHATIGILLDNQIFLTQRGFNHGFFLYKSKNAEYQIFDILKETAHEPPEEYIFKEIIQGQLNPGQSIMFGTESIGSYLTEYNIKRILTLYGITQNTINAHLKEITNNENFCGLILKSTIVNARSISSSKLMSQKNAQNHSLSHLQNTQDRTQELLTPTLFPKMKEYFGNFVAKLSQGKLSNINLKNNSQLQSSNKYLQKILPLVKSAAHWIIFASQKLYSIASTVLKPLISKALPTKFQKKVSLSSKPKRQLTPETNNTHQSHLFSLKNAQNKTMMVGIVLIISAVFISGFVIKSQRLKAQEKQALTTIIAQIDENFLKAESSLIHKAQGRAQIHVDEINSLIKKLSSLESIDTTKEQAVYTEKISELHDSLYQIRKITPEELLDISNEIATAQVTQVASNNESLFITSSTAPFLTIVNTKNNEVKLVETESSSLNLQDVNFYARDKDAPLVLDAEQNMYKVKTSDNTFVSVSIPFDQNNITDFKTFNTNVYTLNPEENQIFKHRQTSTNNFGRAQRWIKDSDFDISNAIDMHIDGSIYVLLQDGSIEQYLSGKRTSFKLNTNIEPQITTVDSLNYSDNTEKFYILEKSQKRILVYNNDGDFLYQYHLEIADNITGISINNEDTSIIILAGNKIYKIDE